MDIMGRIYMLITCEVLWGNEKMFLRDRCEFSDRRLELLEMPVLNLVEFLKLGVLLVV